MNCFYCDEDVKDQIRIDVGGFFLCEYCFTHKVDHKKLKDQNSEFIRRNTPCWTDIRLEKKRKQHGNRHTC